MTKIRILPEQLANQIAAGEVVERPASVVKELVENSLDAQASRIEIDIEGGGTRLIRVIDDGVGMVEDDLLLSLERHGTSKIKSEDDLGAIATLGFRGEAIPSIGSVSKLTITSRIKGEELGTRVVLEYGKLTKVHEVGCRTGTTVEVRSLFGNTPARKKFLRTTRTELGHIEEIIKNYGLGCPKIGFTLRVNGRNSIYFDHAMNVEQRLKNIMRYDDTLLPISAAQSSPLSRKLSGFLLPPEKVTQGPARLRIFVNGRAVRDRMITHGVSEGLRGFLMKGKNPSGMIHLHLDPQEIDVNVHPAKHEIRFRNAREVHSFLCDAVKETMFTHQQRLKSAIFGERVTPGPVPTSNSPYPGRESDHNIEEDIAKSKQTNIQEYSYPADRFAESRMETLKSTSEDSIADSPVLETQREALASVSTMRPVLDTAEPPPKSELVHQDFIREKAGKTSVPSDSFHTVPDTQNLRHNLLVIGQFDDLYIFCKSSEGLLVIDQHAAHERLLYEKLRKQYLENRVASQTLMFPETVELSIFQTQLYEKNNTDFEKMGFSVREFGGNTFIISAVPAIGGKLNASELFLDILEQFGSESGDSRGGGVLDNIIATMACKAAVKAGTSLSSPEIDKLLDEMARADLFSHCPHGRPVVKHFTKDDVKKWFYRT